MKNIAALLYENDAGHLDHLAPFCALYNLPLFLTSKNLYQAACIQYENVEITLHDPTSVCSTIIENYDCLLSTLPTQILKPMFLLEQTFLNKKLSFYWLPHGASDKKNLSPLEEEECLLIYGNKMKRELPKKAQNRTCFIGNFRQKYFLLHQGFYQKLLPKYFSFGEKNILYAPSWEEKNIESWVASLIAKKEKKTVLFIKLHPNTYLKDGAIIKEKFKREKDVFFIENFYPIYPLLYHMDELFTDNSSIGYDFLAFNKKLSFTTKSNDPLHSCGEEVDIKSPYNSLGKSHYFVQRKKLYEQTFTQNCPISLQTIL